ncbi:MAG: hypothetical protein U9N13_00250 [Euryarchaeota archaeon]|nr:hypothetical protein [Euryarchaeota archaeon]
MIDTSIGTEYTILIIVILIFGIALTYLNYKVLTALQQTNETLKKVAQLLESIG